MKENLPDCFTLHYLKNYKTKKTIRHKTKTIREQAIKKTTQLTKDYKKKL